MPLVGVFASVVDPPDEPQPASSTAARTKGTTRKLTADTMPPVATP